MRLRTLPVSVAGVAAGAAVAVFRGCFNVWPVLLCLAFAVLAQVSVNFANEYYDYRDGLDRPGRVGPRRGVTEGDIRPEAMRRAAYATLGVAAAVGCGLIVWGGWWLVLAGAFIIVGAMSYSAGPVPLSRHALGEVAVWAFFGMIPVGLTYYVQSGTYGFAALLWGFAVGLGAANVLIVNNYRDLDDDRAVGKTTLAVVLGPKVTAGLYLFNGLLAVLLTYRWFGECAPWCYVFPAFALAAYIGLFFMLKRREGRRLNPLLGMTGGLLLLYVCAFLLCAAVR